MTQTTSLSNRIAAAASALALSLFLLSGTIAVPSNAQAHNASSYVGQVA
ncbi:MAG: hypothetical protein HOO94_06720 [Novosphingobium sp.]|nr:hypothetical protein [Novosphingobium sp.]